jgi:hypothetical protein
MINVDNQRTASNFILVTQPRHPIACYAAQRIIGKGKKIEWKTILLLEIQKNIQKEYRICLT